MELRHFKAMNEVQQTSEYVAALEAFDSIPQLQELKSIAVSRGGIAPGRSVLDVGCGFGLETLRLAKKVMPDGRLTGIDLCEAFISEAEERAKATGIEVEYRVGDTRALPFADNSFDCVRAERILIYLKDFKTALAEMRRVLKPGGRLALIEPDMSTNTINVANRPLVRTIVDRDINEAVAQSWLPGPLLVALQDLGFAEIEIASRVLIFPQDLGATYFTSIGRHAEEAGAISKAEMMEWQNDIDTLRNKNHVFATIGYFLFTATCL